MSLPPTLIPANDSQRLQALAPYLLLGNAPDAVFDEVVRLTAKLFGVPIALVSLVEEGSVWFKANFGLVGAERVARDESMCSVAILQAKTTVYEDLLREPCQLTEPGIVAALQLRFYAGHPLRTATGEAIGSLCLIDRHPRTLSPEEQARLQRLAAVVMKLLDLRLLLHQETTPSSGIWMQVYHHLDQSLTRLDTLTELAHWEELAMTPAALAYQQSLEEEANVVLQALERQVTIALASFQQ
ncbi:GAF domain-containing protein [Hymenobacter crusticola]|uniref:GAF domain-containing protein n=1 Tax=Hymenobacter crusticola TaxID=1770526 RepID=A0A243W4V5_9BACT|nr:GAF domain-containing protein [Hymenobacter crusticola]OUJ67413.1 hypothetical protein BXP70_28775 [Hymenobacter crusticola]